MNSILLGTSRHQRLSQITIIEGIVNIALSIWLIQRIGVLGVAIGTSIPMFLARFFLLPMYACKSIELPYGTFLWRGLAPALPGILTGSLLGWLIKEELPGADLLSVAATVAATAIGYVAATGILLFVTRDPLWTGFRHRGSEPVAAETVEQGTGVPG